MTNPPKSTVEKILFTANSVGVIGALLYAIIAYFSLSGEIPTHYNFQGEPDQFGDKGFILFIPCIALFIFLLFTGLSHFPDGLTYPKNMSEEGKEKMFRFTRLMMQVLAFEIISFLLYLTVMDVQIAQDNAKGIGTYTGYLFIASVIITVIAIMVTCRKFK
ncbi:DUF1648 domain-containing protein [Priestia taiwanensis]|uniref:DUF1648 domain-containing protein n=1 Tax=Priestia taiwanensis TaxID=1347902 RepID=A0A917EQV0_9BACI|nr:DUF1648 domain-containing protein [Priestia taiwanensis]MBM7363135.1 putative membrane protein [Priestia taiwanensis]GGE67981.1 hypothetical protein GCM10007140_17550 [Priestia taiwanensis]